MLHDKNAKIAKKVSASDKMVDELLGEPADDIINSTTSSPIPEQQQSPHQAALESSQCRLELSDEMKNKTNEKTHSVCHNQQ